MDIKRRKVINKRSGYKGDGVSIRVDSGNDFSVVCGVCVCWFYVRDNGWVL